jgi:hypothetical protein
VSVTSHSLDLKNTLFNCQKRDIESSTTKIENQHVPSANDFLIKAIRR